MLTVIRLAAGLAGLSVQRVVSRVKTVSILLMMALMFLFFGLCGFVVALGIVLTNWMEPLTAALLIGGGGFVAAGLMILILRSGRRADTLVFGAPLTDPRQTLAEQSANAMGSTIWGSLLAVAVLGYVVTRRGGKS
jgi:hypothetical protein